MQIVVIASTPSQSEMFEAGRVEVALHKEIIFSDILDANVHDVPLNVVYPDSYFEGEISQGTNSDIESDNDQLNPRRSKATFSLGAHDAKVGSSSTAGDPSAPPPSKKIKLIFLSKCFS
ncbi:unnamed protein product [Lactuca saligna]|uniref:Uncharacterized protein n=1 Tax=Lactuca saligna TaxID=75948 RepID=A0AA36E1A8_LACSI|nr:unnamed protein product [Lactuca saligna]